jgi:hypothetical protein
MGNWEYENTHLQLFGYRSLIMGRLAIFYRGSRVRTPPLGNFISATVFSETGINE